MTSDYANLPILLVEDDRQALAMLESLLTRQGFKHLVLLDNGQQALDFLTEQDVAAVVLDLQLPGVSGIELLRLMTARKPYIPIIIVTGENQLEKAIECMKSGAADYLTKPIAINRLTASINRAIELRGLNEEILSLQAKRSTSPEPVISTQLSGVVTQNRVMLEQLRYLEVVAGSRQPVLICGETGVGKELFARAVHDLSRRKGMFVSVNVAGLDDLMFSDSLFGHQKGAYTGAMQSRDGLIKKAANGTLLLDEIGDLNESSQVKLLRLLQENEYYPLGQDSPIENRARLVFATNHNLLQQMKDGRFRKDLYYRLCSHQMTIPPLRERKDDIPLLLAHFVADAAVSMGREKPSYRQELVEMLSLYDFPGNVRELHAMVLDGVARCATGKLSVATFRNIISREQGETSKGDSLTSSPPCRSDGAIIFESFPTLRDAEIFLIRRALELARGNQGQAAQLLGVTRQALNNRLRRDKGELLEKE